MVAAGQCEVQEEVDWSYGMREMNMFERIRQMLIKEFIQVFRDPRMRTVIFVIPCVQVLVIGYAVTTDVRHVPTAIYDLDNSTASRELTARFVGSGYFDVVATSQTTRQARELIDRSEAIMVLQFDHGFADDLRAGRTAAAASDRRRHRLEHGRHRARLRQQDRHATIRSRSCCERFDRLAGAAGRPVKLDLRTPGVVQREPGKPQLLRARRDRHRGEPCARCC